MALRRPALAALGVVALTVAAGCAASVATDPPTATRPAPPTALAPPASTYRSPVIAPVADGFRLPATPYGPGNRGIEYSTEPGRPVRAAGRGVVAFAGSVAGSGVVSIEHPDGLRTTYTHLAVVDVAVGQAVDTGQVIGSSSDRLHFGVRLGGAYLDPLALITAGRGPATLVPGEPSARGQPVE